MKGIALVGQDDIVLPWDARGMKMIMYIYDMDNRKISPFWVSKRLNISDARDVFAFHYITKIS